MVLPDGQGWTLIFKSANLPLFIFDSAVGYFYLLKCPEERSMHTKQIDIRNELRSKENTSVESFFLVKSVYGNSKALQLSATFNKAETSIFFIKGS